MTKCLSGLTILVMKISISSSIFDSCTDSFLPGLRRRNHNSILKKFLRKKLNLIGGVALCSNFSPKTDLRMSVQLSEMEDEKNFS